MTRLALLLSVGLAVAGCGQGLDPDILTMSGPVIDARIDAPEEPIDSRPPDASPPDAAPPDAGPPDAFPVAEGPEMVDVAAGAFIMGCADGDTLCNDDEKPQHLVMLDDFLIDRLEVSQRDYATCVQSGVCEKPIASCTAYDPVAHPDFPAVCVTWNGAFAYCAAKGKRLPSEAEWEKAARGATPIVYPWGAAQPDCVLADFATCGMVLTPVGSHPTGASPALALDMSGNVDEWVQDWYDAAYYAGSPSAQPTGPSSPTNLKVTRGGGYRLAFTALRTSARAWGSDTDGAQHGFRCARTP